MKFQSPYLKNVNTLAILYLFFLIFEGAFRKWFLPSLADLFLLVRDPIAIAIVYIGFKRKVLPNYFVLFVLIFSSAEAFKALLFGDNLYVFVYGIRTLFLHLAAIYCFGSLMSSITVDRCFKFLLISVVVVTPLVLAQGLSYDRLSIVNVGVGGVGTSAFSVSGAGGLEIRPSGTFSFITGLAAFASLSLSVALSNLLFLKRDIALSFIAIVCCTIIIVFGLSRTLYFSAGFVVLTAIMSSFWSTTSLNLFRINKKLLLISTVSLILIFILSLNPFISSKLESFSGRWQSSVVDRGGIAQTVVPRLLVSFSGGSTRERDKVVEPVLGVGVGAGTRVGAKLSGIKNPTLMYGESDSSRILNELGMLRGYIYIFFRYIIALSILYLVLSKKSPTALTLLSGVFPLLFVGQFSQPAILGFACFGSALSISSIKLDTSDA